MPEFAVAEDVYSAIEEAAQLVGATCSREKVWPILTAHGKALSEAGIVFNVTTGGRHVGDLDYSITMPPAVGDPYALALSNGLVTETDHPASALIPDIQKRISISDYLVDYGIGGSLNKIYPHYPQDMRTVSNTADIPSMPPALGENAAFFARHGLDDVVMVGVDYQHKTANVYFQLSAEKRLESKVILSMLREIGAPEPDERLLSFAQGAFRVYVTLDWDSPKIHRISFARPPGRGLMSSDVATLPTRIEPEIVQFLKSAPHTYAGERIQIVAIKWSPDGESLSFGSCYQLSPLQRKILAPNEE
ncbi:aromatic prenyltransferase [Streptomyces sp. SBT349]|uniref:aromatic prenyltransferase n=1 Tax=Streptomyces sp. SBT349 TaxID=1580539 RepID=UPI0007C673C8|nr:aromatic prenyltransferase [Streptomyces sp. SBT349]